MRQGQRGSAAAAPGKERSTRPPPAEIHLAAAGRLPTSALYRVLALNKCSGAFRNAADATRTHDPVKSRRARGAYVQALAERYKPDQIDCSMSSKLKTDETSTRPPPAATFLHGVKCIDNTRSLDASRVPLPRGRGKFGLRSRRQLALGEVCRQAIPQVHVALCWSSCCMLVGLLQRAIGKGNLNPRERQTSDQDAMWRNDGHMGWTLTHL